MQREFEGPRTIVFLNPKALPDGDASTPLGPVLDPTLPTVLRLID